MKVRAIKPGFYGSHRGAGEEFNVKDGAKAKWFAPVESATVAKPKGRGKAAPETFNEVAQADAATVAPEGGGGDLV